MFVPKAKPARETFLSSALGGLAAGVTTAAASFMVVALFGFAFGAHGSAVYFPAMVIGLLPIAAIIMLVAAALAIFPIGPMWLLTAWLLRRGGFTAPWVYALAGATVAAYLPLMPLVLSLVTASKMADAPLYAVWFALSGAIGGYATGRALRRVDQRAFA